MKRILMLCALCALILLTRNARAMKTTFIVKGGLNMGLMLNDPDYTSANKNLRLGPALGAGVDLEWEGLGIEINLLYEQKGETFGFYEDVRKYDYLTLPVLLKGIMRNQNIGIFFGIGFGPAILVSSELELNDATTSRITDLSPFTSSMDMNGIAAIGIEILRKVTIEGRVSFGLLNVIDDLTTTATSHTLTIGILAGVRFDIPAGK